MRQKQKNQRIILLPLTHVLGAAMENKAPSGPGGFVGPPTGYKIIITVTDCVGRQWRGSARAFVPALHLELGPLLRSGFWADAPVNLAAEAGEKSRRVGSGGATSACRCRLLRFWPTSLELYSMIYFFIYFLID